MTKKNSLLFGLLFFTKLLFAQFTEFHPELDWYTIDGEHVKVHYHNGAERTAKVVAKIADEVWGPITSLYNYQPEIVHFVIKDVDDYSNGATYFFDNKIEIWASALDFDLRGTHNWLRNVISHEFTHMVQIQSAMKFSRKVPAGFLQVLNYEDVRRPDILYGFPNVIVSYPLATINVPAWFAEGTAQYMRKEFGYDMWDSHRDMILRNYALDGNMLTWNQMGSFGKTSLGNESVYNAGFALTRFISQKYGEEKLSEISHSLGYKYNFTIDAAFKDVLGKDGDEIYREWKSFITTDYKERSQNVLSNLVEGDKIASEGFGNFYPHFFDKGNKVLYVSNKSNDYFGLSSIFLYDLKTKTEKLLAGDVRSSLSDIPNSNSVVFSRLTEDNPNWYNVHDLFVYDLNSGEEKRLTFDMRANQPNVSHSGKQIVFIFQKDGTTNLGLIQIDGSNFKQLSFFNNGEQIYNPKFSIDDKQIIFGYSDKSSRDIKSLNLEDGKIKDVIATPYDDRNPAIKANGNIIYSSDETGIFNLYEFDLKTQRKKQLTNVIGGAFMPDVDENGNIVYAGYTSSGYKIFLINSEQQKNVDPSKKYVSINNPPLQKDKPKGDLINFDLSALKNFNDKQTPDYKSKKYKGTFSSLSIFPVLRYDNYTTENSFLQKLKPGIIISSNDMLDRYSLFAGGLINASSERDLFLIFEFKNKIPLLTDLGLKPVLSLELYNLTRKSNVDVLFGVDSTFIPPRADFTAPAEVTYSLFEADFVIANKIINRLHNLELRFIYSTYTSSLGSFLLPDNSLFPSTNDNYFIGRNFQAKYHFKTEHPYVDADINPLVYELDLQYNYQFNKFNENGDFIVENGFLKPLFKKFNFSTLELNSKFTFDLKNENTLTARVRAASILGPPVSDFFDYYLGGLIGMKEYPFYSISGNEVAWLNLTYRFPLFKNIDTRIAHLYIDKMFLSFFGDIGNGWTGGGPVLSDFKKGLGSELRIQMNSFYLFPTSVFVSAAYGFDKFTRVFRKQEITYGKEWRFYGGILFGFDF